MDPSDLRLIASQISGSAYVVHKEALLGNLNKLQSVAERSGARLLLALKGYACHSTFKWVKDYVHGVAASSPHEAELGQRKIGKAIHSYAPAYSEADIRKLAPLSHHIVFNSTAQLERFHGLARELNPELKFGIRLNPEHSEATTELYNPSSPQSRLGIRACDWNPDYTEMISGVHIHNLCENDSFALERTLNALEAKFEQLIKNVAWINMGGGHLATRKGYDDDHLVQLLINWKERYGHDIYLEPGGAFGWQIGVLKSTVLDIKPAGTGEVPNVILDISATAHMPDVLEMPYRPEVFEADLPNKKPYTYRLGGLTCLAGDVVGEYSFGKPLSVGDAIIFMDMAHYTMVKTSFFNGVQMPAIAIYSADSKTTEIIKEFGYEDYAGKLS
jgi:carboxynorspermidine decarboxylase